MTPAPCPKCQGKGWLLFLYPYRKPRPVFWFQRGRNGERPTSCDRCDGTGEEP
jgi:hypothetical protein